MRRVGNSSRTFARPMAPIAITLDQAKQCFARAHAAAVKVEPLSKVLFDRWKAELLLAAHGEPEDVRAVMHYKLALALEILAERKAWPDSIAGFAR